MKPNTAVGFLCAGLVLVLVTSKVVKLWTRVVAAAASAVVIFVGLLTLLEYAFHWNLIFDQLLFQDRVQFPYPGRMAYITALNFCLTGTSLLMMALSEKQAKWPQFFSLLSGFIATFAIVGYLYGVPSLYGSIYYTSMALHSGAGFMILSAAILYCRPGLGLMRVVSDRRVGGWLARRLLPAAVIVPASLGAIYVHSGFVPLDMRLALAGLIVGQIALFVTLIWSLGFLLNRSETEKVVAQTALRQSEELLEQRYRTMFEEAVVGIFQSTPQGRFLSVNQAMAKLFGYESPADMISSIADIGSEIYVDERRRQDLKAEMQQHGEVQNFECHVRRKDGSKMWITANIRAVREGGAIVRYEGTNSDITERKLLQEQLVQSQKMEAVGRLAGGVAHDFNNAIGVIVGYSVLLGDRLSSDAKGLLYTEEISKAGHRAASLTRQLLAFSRKQVIQPTVLDLNAVVSDTQKMLQRLIGEDIEMTVILGQHLAHVMADRGQVEQVLMNLAINARDAMPQGGQLVIETQNAELDNTVVVQHSYAKPGNYVVLSVSDSGCGMDKETQAHIFEPFFTTKGVGKGTGLGLSTVYGIVKQSDGYIWVYSEPGKGARFKIYWPRTARAEQVVAVRPQLSALPTGTETILLVEDDDSMRELTCNCLAKAGYTVLSAPHGEAAIHVASQHEGAIHLLLTDVVMPGMSGRRLAESLASYRTEIRYCTFPVTRLT